MLETPKRQPESLTSNDDLDELEKVLQFMAMIDDAYESGYVGPDISELIQKMNKQCDPDVIVAVQEARRLAARSQLKGPSQ